MSYLTITFNVHEYNIHLELRILCVLTDNRVQTKNKIQQPKKNKYK